MKTLPLILLLCGITFFLQVQAQTRQTLSHPLISLTANQSLTNDGTESLVIVTGQVHQQLLSNSTDLIPAPQVEVRFWQPGAPTIFFKALTDADGRYSIGLNDGLWVGEACGSANGYYPAAWNLLVEDDALKRMQAVARKTIELDFLHPSNLVNQHAVTTLRGRGFGCNGSLVFTYSNSVDRCDKALAVEYHHESERISTFSLRTDTELEFEMPELSSNRNVTRHIAFVHYEQGSNKSERIPIGESVLASQSSNTVLCQGDSPATETSTSVLADVASDSVPSGLDSQTSSSGNPQLGGGYNPNGLTSNDFGAHTHLQAENLNTSSIQLGDVSVQGEF